MDIIEHVVREQLAFCPEVVEEAVGRVQALPPTDDLDVYAEQVAQVCRAVLEQRKAQLQADLATQAALAARLDAISQAMAAPTSGVVH